MKDRLAPEGRGRVKHPEPSGTSLMAFDTLLSGDPQ